eukprot:3460156-Amphidinium_carterae.1
MQTCSIHRKRGSFKSFAHRNFLSLTIDLESNSVAVAQYQRGAHPVVEACVQQLPGCAQHQQARPTKRNMHTSTVQSKHTHTVRHNSATVTVYILRCTDRGKLMVAT